MLAEAAKATPVSAEELKERLARANAAATGSAMDDSEAGPSTQPRASGPSVAPDAAARHRATQQSQVDEGMAGEVAAAVEAGKEGSGSLPGRCLHCLAAAFTLE